MKTLLLLTVANIKSLTRDRAALFWTFLFPVMFVLLFGAIFSGSGNSKITVGYVDEDKSAASTALKAGFEQVGLLDLQVGTREDELDAMKNGKVSAVIIIPKGVQDAIVSKAPVAIEVYTDATSTQTRQVVESIVDKMRNAFNLRLANGTEILTLTSKTIQTEGLTAVGYLVP